MEINKLNITSVISHVRFLNNEVISDMLKNRGITNLKTSYGNIIYTLLKHDTLTMKDIAHYIKRDKSTVTVLLRNLEQNGYTIKKDNPNDARSKFITLTQKGKDLADIFKLISLDIHNIIWEEINDEKIEIFFEVLSKIIINLENIRSSNNE